MRKTNLFYIEGNDSKFLTFSNYGEYLTGVHLSTDHKIFPSSFICLDLPFDNNSKSVKNFKKFLMCYYENKLATLRDYLNDNLDANFENYIVELSYLLEGIIKFFDLQDGLTINYYGDIVEHDYNGSFSDAICVVDLGRWLKSHQNITLETNNELITSNTNTLHNWDDEEYHDILLNYHPIYDTTNNTIGIESDTLEDQSINYNLHNNCIVDNGTTIVFNTYSEISDVLQFNCIIPLFDVLNVNIKTNNNLINEQQNTINLSTSDIDENNKYMNIPYGIWIYPTDDNYESRIILQKQENYNQSWSLLLASKFAPYPYGIKIKDEVQKPIEQYTYAELLTYVSQLLDRYNQISTEYIQLIQRVSSIENVLQSYIKLDIDTLQTTYDQKLNEFKSDINTEIDNLKLRLADFKWKNILKDN